MTKLTDAEKDKLDNTCGNLRVTKLGTHVKSLEDFVNEGVLATRANDVTSAINELYGMIVNNECADIQIPPPGFFTIFGNDEDGKLYVYYNDEDNPPVFRHVETEGELEGTLYLYIADPEGENHFEMEIGHYIAVRHLDNYYTKAEIDAGYAIKDHAVNASTYGLGSTSKFGHVKTINGLTQASHADGLALSAYQGKVLKTAVDEKVVTVEKQSTAESGYSATYIVKQNNAQVGVKINIPKDFLVKSTSVKTCTTANQPVNGYEVGDIYIDWVVNSKDNTATDEHLYLRAKDIGSYPPDEVTLTIVNNQFKIKDGGVGSTQLASDSVLTAKIKDANVTTAKIKDGNVTTAKIKDGNVTTAKIADSNVTTAKIADGAVTNDKVTSITKNKISDFSHAHGNLQNDGKVGTTDNANKNVVTDGNGKITTEAKPTIPSANSTATNIKMDGTQSAGSLSTFAKADHVHPTDTSRAASSHTHGSLTNGGTLNSDIPSVNKVAVTDSSNNLKTISKVPFANLNITKDNITGLGIPASDTNTTYSAVTQSANGLAISTDKAKLDKSMVVGFANAAGTTSAYTATITGVTLTHGTIIALYNAVGANAASATLNVNSLGAKPIYYNASAIPASRYPNKATCLFMYNTSIVSTGVWQLIYSYDSNNTYTAATLKDPNAHSEIINTAVNAYQTAINSALDAAIKDVDEKCNDIVAGDIDLSSTHTHTKSQITDFPTSMTPSSHSHGDISNDGVISGQASKNVVTDANGKITTEAKPTIPSANSTATNIKMDGTQSAGSLSTFAKADHVHPTDTSRASTATASASANGLMSKEDKAKMDKSMVVGQANVGGTTSAYTATITGVTLTHGTIIALYNAVGANAASATLNVNSLGAKPIYYNASAIPASRYPNKATCLFMYNTSIVSTGVWQLIYSYDSNSTYTAASATPLMDGTAAVGTATKYAREDHVHPTDTSRAAASHSHTKSEISDFPTSMTPASHAHGNITNAGAIGSTANLPVITTTSGKLTTGSFGTAANTFCQGNDSRLSDARTPTSHAHGSITNDGKVGTAANKPLITGTNGVVSAGSFEGTATNIKMNGTQSVGSLNTFARGDHVHPVDTSRAPKSHTSTATDYGVSDASNYGHAMASSTTPTTLGTADVGSETGKFARGDHVHAHPAYTARTGKPTANQTPAFGGTATVSQIISDATGHVTGATDRTIKIPDTSASTSAKGIVQLVNDVTTGGTDKALTAEQGKTLNNKVTSITTHNSSSATTIKDSFITSGWTGTVRYYIRNGWCIITYEGLKKTSTTTGYDALVDTQLNNDMGYEVFANTDLSNYMPVMVKINANNGKLMARCIKANTELYGSIVFPIS